MEQKLILIGLTALLCAGVSQALKCYKCTYQVTGENSDDANTDGCQGGNDFNETALMPEDCSNKCFAKYMKTDDNYKWERGCSANCEEKNGGADDWMTCCSTENCNKHIKYPTDPKKLSQCYKCSYMEVNGTAKQGQAAGAEKCMKEDVTDDSIAMVACNTNCFFERKTNGDEVTWSRGCKDPCSTTEDDDDFLRCCTGANLCNGESKTSGCDVIFRPGNLMLASAVVVMTAVLRQLF